MTERPRPVVQTLLLADFVRRDPRTNKYDIYGVFGGVACPQFPIVLPDLWVYLVVTELHGPTAIQVRVVGADEDTLHFSVELTGTADSPLVVVESGFVIHGAQFTEPGLYRLQVVSAGAVIAERNLHLALTGGRVPDPGPGGVGRPQA